MKTSFRRYVWVTVALLVCMGGTGIASGDEPEKKDGWVSVRDKQAGITVQTMELTLHPKPEPRPAMKYRLLPDEFEMLDRNAAIYYLKAMGFLEQNAARNRLDEINSEADAQARKAGKMYSEVPPEVWRSTPPNKLPLDEVKKYLQITSFQRPLLREAARRKGFDLDRNLRGVEDPVGYLLPDIQVMRALARTQDLRCRLAIAEGRIDDAIAILGQQYAMARHLGQDEFAVSNLVGIACVGIAWNDALYLVQHPDTPNLYWAFASMPRPLVDIRRSMAIERQILYEQLKVLREVDETPRPAEYWRDFVDRLMPQVGHLAREFHIPGIPDDPKLARASVVGFIATAYPGAKEYLVKECHLSSDQVEAYPTAQVVFLAVVRYYDQWRDELFKWTTIPFWQARYENRWRDTDNAMSKAENQFGWCARPARVLLPTFWGVRIAQARSDQMIALVQTVEAIRMYGAAHDGTLPASLSKLPVPAPLDPFTGQPFKYQCHGTRAVLDGYPTYGVQYRLVLRFAGKPK